MKKLKIVVLFGGVSPEHEVSIITGLQVVENISEKQFDAYPMLLTQDKLFKYFPYLTSRKGFKEDSGVLVKFGRDSGGAYFQKDGAFSRKKYIDGAYLALHGGNGENGEVQGFFETLGVPITSSPVEGSAISMNKALTKEVLNAYGILNAKAQTVLSQVFLHNPEITMRKINKELKLPVIIKPAHLGSSIGVKVARNQVELRKFLTESTHMDKEILVEEFLSGFDEYNCSARKIGNEIETSEIEKLLADDEILSFSDKYQKGGSKKKAGMASLHRELPAKISKSLRMELQNLAKRVYLVCRLQGVVRIDFMVIKNGKILVTEINPIPGSMSYYLWEATGVNFKDQITQSIEQAIDDNQEKDSKVLKYETDIVKKFVSNSKGR